MTHSDHTNPSSNDRFDGDELLLQLNAANPVPTGAESPSAKAAADTLFDQITSRSGGFTPYVDAEATRSRRSGSSPASGGTAGDKRSRAGLLAAVAAVAVLVVGALVVLAPTGTQPALAVVQAAAQETADAQSGRVITEFDVVGREDAAQESLRGSMTAAFVDDDFAVSIDLDPSSTALSASETAEIGQAETRLVDGQLFATTDGEQWISVEAPEILQSSLARLTDLRSILAQVEDLVDVEVVRSTDLDGLAVTHYRGTVDLADQTLAESGWLPGAQGTGVDIDAQGLVTVDLYVDDSGLMRRIEVSGEAEPIDDEIDASADFRLTTNFVDLGGDISIDAPDPSVVETLDFDPSGGLAELDD